MTGQMLTFGSCEGHRSIFGVTSPYVYFKCTVTFAEKFAAAVFHNGPTTKKLRYNWRFIGLFHPEHGLCFHLAMSPRWFSRRKVDEDIRLLIHLIEVLTEKDVVN